MSDAKRQPTKGVGDNDITHNNSNRSKRFAKSWLNTTGTSIGHHIAQSAGIDIPPWCTSINCH
jgi:hypothetical protein